MRVLLIEPDKLQTRVYAAALEGVGHNVVCASTAQDAIQAADESMPELIVLELQLPGHNGIEFLYEFRSYTEWLHIPVLVHTFVSRHELEHGRTLEKELGVCGILYKPATTLTILCQTVQDLSSGAK